MFLPACAQYSPDGTASDGLRCEIIGRRPLLTETAVSLRRQSPDHTSTTYRLILGFTTIPRTKDLSRQDWIQGAETVRRGPGNILTIMVLNKYHRVSGREAGR